MLSSQTSNHDTSKSALSQVEQRQSSVSAVVRCPHRSKGAATAIGGWSSGGWARTAARTAAEAAAATELSQQEVVGIKARQDKTRNNSPSDSLASRGESACARVKMKGEKAQRERIGKYTHIPARVFGSFLDHQFLLRPAARECKRSCKAIVCRRMSLVLIAWSRSLAVLFAFGPFCSIICINLGVSPGRVRLVAGPVWNRF